MAALAAENNTNPLDSRVLVPGEPEAAAWDKRTVEGIPVANGTLKELLKAGEGLGIPLDEAYTVLGITAEGDAA